MSLEIKKEVTLSKAESDTVEMPFRTLREKMA